MRNFIIFFLGISFFLLSSCFKSLKTEEAVLEEETLIRLLTDIHLAEARLSDYNSMKLERRDSFATAYYYSIFQIHQADTADFQQSMEAYANNPEEMNQLYEKVLTRLQQNESKYVKGSKSLKDRNPKGEKQKEKDPKGAASKKDTASEKREVIKIMNKQIPIEKNKTD